MLTTIHIHVDRTFHHDIFHAYPFEVNKALNVAALTTPCLNESGVVDNITISLAYHASASPFFIENLGLKATYRATAHRWYRAKGKQTLLSEENVTLTKTSFVRARRFAPQSPHTRGVK